MRLSRTAWNNVIIFSVMGFILLINLTTPKNTEQQESGTGTQTVIGEHNVILTMTINQRITIERVGQSWRSTSELLSSQMIEQMMRSWHTLQGQITDIDIDQSQQQGLLVTMMFAGQQSIAMFSVYALSDQLIILNHQQGRYYALPALMFNQLIPPVLGKV